MKSGVTNYYGFGVGTEYLKNLKAVPKENRTEVLQDLFNRLHLKAEWVEPWEKSKRGQPSGVPKRKRKVLNIWAMREENAKVKRVVFFWLFFLLGSKKL